MNSSSDRSTIWYRLTTPIVAIADVDRQRRARLIASLTLGLTIVTVLAFLIEFLLALVSGDFDPFDVFSGLLPTILGALLYVASRSGYDRQATAALVVLTTILFVALARFDAPPQLLYLVVVQTVVAIFYGIRAVAGYTLMALFVSIGIALILSIDPERVELLTSFATLLLAEGALLALFIANRRAQERDRRAELEAVNAELRATLDRLEHARQEQETAAIERERLQQTIIDSQRQTLAELSTPIIPLMDGIIVVPLTGSIDRDRARQILRSLLAGISQNRAHTVLLDVTGVPAIDSHVANDLDRIIQASYLKGTRTIVTGISPQVAETIITPGIDWSGIETLRDLQSGLEAIIKGR